MTGNTKYSTHIIFSFFQIHFNKKHDIIKKNSDENINLSPDDKNERKAESDIDYSDEEIKDKSNEDKEAETDNIVPLKQELPQQPYDIVENANFVRWYSGNSNEVLFEITKYTEKQKSTMLIIIYVIGLNAANVFMNNKANPINHKDKNNLTVVKKSLNNFINDLHNATNGFGVI